MMAAKKKTRKNGGQQPTMQPTQDVRNTAEETADNDLEALETMAGELDATAACDPALEEDEILEAETQTVENELADALAAANAKADEYLSLAQHVQADFDNYRRRTQNTRSDAFEDGAKAFITTLLPVFDNLERAITAAESSTDQNLKEGVAMVYRQFDEALTKRGVTSIDRKGEKFDPNLENAVLQGVPEDGEPGTVCEVLQKGYQLGNSVLRHAMVKVVPE